MIKYVINLVKIFTYIQFFNDIRECYVIKYSTERGNTLKLQNLCLKELKIKLFQNVVTNKNELKMNQEYCNIYVIIIVLIYCVIL